MTNIRRKILDQSVKLDAQFLIIRDTQRWKAPGESSRSLADRHVIVSLGQSERGQQQTRSKLIEAERLLVCKCPERSLYDIWIRISQRAQQRDQDGVIYSWEELCGNDRPSTQLTVRRNDGLPQERTCLPCELARLR